MAINLYSKASVDGLLSFKLSIGDLSNGATTTLNATAPTTDQVLSFDGTELKWATPAGGTAVWGGITGTLSDQTDLNTVLNLKAPLASPVFTGNPTAPTPATGDNDTSIATTAFVKAQGYLTSSAAASTYYPLTNPSNFVIPNGTTSIQVTGGTVRSIDASDNFTSLDGSALNFGNLGTGVGGLSVTGTGITFADSTVQTTAGIGDAPSDSQTYGRNNGAWVVAGGGGGSGTLTYSSPYIYDTVTASNINSLDLSSGTLTCGQVIAGNGTVDSSGLTLTASSGAVITFADGTTQSTQPHDLPIGGTTGQVLTKNSATDYDASWATASGGGGGVDVQTFGDASTSGSFTWTKPTGAKYLEIWLFGGGGGGGSGAVQATTSGRAGGGGGSGGSYLFASIGADAVPSSVTVTVGAKGTGGASRTTAGSGNNGTAGGSTTFGSIFRAFGGSFGSGGTTTNGFAGTFYGSQAFHYVSTTGSGGNGTLTSGSSAGNLSTFSVPSGGGGGAGAAASSVVNANGGNGGTFSNGGLYAGLPSNIAGGSPGTSTGTQATNGADSPSAFFSRAGTGGGGGFYRSNFAGGTAGNGGWPGGGGGGGGASNDGFNSGAGGNGANGFAVIITYT